MKRYTVYFIWKLLLLLLLLSVAIAAGSSNALKNTRFCKYSRMRS